VMVGGWGGVGWGGGGGGGGGGYGIIHGWIEYHFFFFFAHSRHAGSGLRRTREESEPRCRWVEYKCRWMLILFIYFPHVPDAQVAVCAAREERQRCVVIGGGGTVEYIGGGHGGIQIWMDDCFCTFQTR